MIFIKKLVGIIQTFKKLLNDLRREEPSETSLPRAWHVFGIGMQRIKDLFNGHSCFHGGTGSLGKSVK